LKNATIEEEPEKSEVPIPKFKSKLQDATVSGDIPNFSYISP